MTTWKQIYNEAYKLPKQISNDTDFQNFLSLVHPNCKKCQRHYNNYKRPKEFKTRDQVLEWITKLRADIKKNECCEKKKYRTLSDIRHVR